jgi:hypothetical protein
MDGAMDESIWRLGEAATEGHNKVCCPQCHAELEFRQFAAFKPTVMTVAYTVEDGHMMGLKSIGGSLSALHDLLVASAKQLGGNVAPLLKGARISGCSYEFDILIAEAAPKKRKKKLV